MRAWYAATVVLAVILGLCAAGLLDRSPARGDIVGEITPTFVRRGETIEIEYHLTVLRDCHAVVYSSISSHDDDWFSPIDPWDISAGSRTGDRTDRRRTVASPPLVIPHQAPIGRANYHAKAQFFCNPMHYIVPLEQDYPAIPFTIGE